MTNIVLDGFNGKMVPAGNSEELYKGIKYLIENPLERERIALSGYESVKRSFSFERWKREWEDILNPYLK
jgi:spore maturation protein CgeB